MNTLLYTLARLAQLQAEAVDRVALHEACKAAVEASGGTTADTASAPDVLEAMLALSARQRAVVYLTYWLELTAAEVADRRLKIDPRSVRAAYLERVRAHLQTIETACGQLQADYHPVSTKQPYSQALLDYLSRRGRR